MTKRLRDPRYGNNAVDMIIIKRLQSDAARECDKLRITTKDAEQCESNVD